MTLWILESSLTSIYDILDIRNISNFILWHFRCKKYLWIYFMSFWILEISLISFYDIFNCSSNFMINSINFRVFIVPF